MLVQHAVKPAHLVPVPLLGIRQDLGRGQARGVFQKVMRLARHRADAAHLPHQPLVDIDPVTFGLAAELARLARQILQDGARFEDRDRRAVGTLGIDDGGHPVVGRDFQEFRFELLALADVHRVHIVGQAHLFQRDGDLPAVRRGPVVQVDGRGHGRVSFCLLYMSRDAGMARRRPLCGFAHA